MANKEKKLQIWWIPQVPVKLLDVLAEYDKFQLENKIKPDYCNAGGLQQWDEASNEWEDWYDDATGEDNPRAFVNADE